MEWWQPGLHRLSGRDGWTRGTYRRERIRLPSFSFRELRLIFRRAFPASVLRSIPRPIFLPEFHDALHNPQWRESGYSLPWKLHFRGCIYIYIYFIYIHIYIEKVPFSSRCLNYEITPGAFGACRSNDRAIHGIRSLWLDGNAKYVLRILLDIKTTRIISPY